MSDRTLPAAVVNAVRRALGGRPSARLHQPAMLDADMRERLPLMLATGYADIVIPREFESAIADRLGVKHAVAVSSGTAALHLALLAVGMKPGSNVYVPALTFAAAAAAVCYTGARPWFYPHAGDRYPEQPDALIDVDLLGIPSQTGINDKWPTIHDAAQALGSRDHIGVPCGRPDQTEDQDYELVDTGVAILSFNNNKIISTGGGGMLLTNDDKIAETARYLANQAKEPSPHFYDHKAVGFNYRMPAACAAIGLLMLDRLDAILEAKARVHAQYKQAFAGIDEVTVVEAPAGTTWNHWLNAIEVPEGQRDAVLTALSAAGYECRALFTPLPRLEPYARFAQGQTFPEADRRFATTVCLPSGAELGL